MAKLDNNIPDSTTPSLGLLYYNGDFVEGKSLRIPPDDRGFLYGDGLFETIRAYTGKPFRARDHAERMLKSAAALGITVKFSAEDLEKKFQETCDRNASLIPRELYLRATLTRGNGYGPDILKHYSPNLLVYVKPLPEPEPAIYRDGISAIISPEPRAAGSQLHQHKSTSYLECLLARWEATKKGVAEALILDTDGKLLEGACSNLFIIKDGTLVTPPATMNLLPGITRLVVLELAAKLGIATVEEEFPPEKLLGADEAFLTNSIQELVPLVAVAGMKIGEGVPGEISKKLLIAYREETQGASA
ncbi:MAG: aminotransferase class IV [Planctomycetes bacterium]|nr:aminotransferase class IV [Planctomycetota bacterium]